MGRKKNADATPRPTKPVRVDADLAFMLDVISTAFDEDISRILSPHVRPFIEKKYDEALKRLAERRRPPAS